MAKMSINFAGLEFRNPVFISSSTLTNNLQKLKNLEAAGAGAVITKLASSATPPPHDRQPYRSVDMGNGTWCVASGDRRLGLEEGIQLIKAAKKELKIPVIANVIGKSYFAESWVENVKALEDAGADMLELDGNCQIFHTIENGEPVFTGESITSHPDLISSIVHLVKNTVKIPVIVKLSPVFDDMTEMAMSIKNGGADGVSAINAMAGFAGVDIRNGGKPRYIGMVGEDGRPVQAMSALCGADVAHQAARHTVLLAQRVGIPICSGSGIYDWEIATQRLMEGARAIQLCSSVYLGGLQAVTDIVNGIDQFLDAYGYKSVEDIIGHGLKYVTDGKEKIIYKPLVAEILNPKWDGWSEVADRINADCLALKMENGKPAINEDECTGCGLCTFRVPEDVVRLKVHE